MKPITEKQRQALIERLKKIASWAETYGPDHNVMLPASEAKEMAEAYIASLTAEPVGYTYDRGIDCEIVAADLYDSAKINCDLYSQPSVPVIQLPEKYTDYEDFLTDSEQGYNDAIDEIKRLNGIS